MARFLHFLVTPGVNYHRGKDLPLRDFQMHASSTPGMCVHKEEVSCFQVALTQFRAVVSRGQCWLALWRSLYFPLRQSMLPARVDLQAARSLHGALASRKPTRSLAPECLPSRKHIQMST